MPDSFAASADGLLFVANGVNPVLKWDGLAESMDTAGISPPTTAPTIAASGSGSITGVYYAYLRFVDALGNASDLSPISNSVTAASNGTVSYAGVEAPAEAKVVKRQLLRSTAGQTRVFYVDVETEDLTGTSFSSTRTDTELQAQAAVALFDDKNNALANVNAVPPDHKSLISAHLGRMFLAGEEVSRAGCVSVAFGSKTVTGVGTEWFSNFAGRFLWVSGSDRSYEIESADGAAQTLTLVNAYEGVTDPYAAYAVRAALPERRLVYFSEAGKPESWPPTSALEVQEDGDEVTALMPKGSFLYIGERRHLYRLTYQDSPLEDGFVFLTAGRGVVNNRSWAVVDDRAFLLDEAGVYSFSGGQQVEDLSTPIQDLFEPARGRPPRYKVQWSASRWFHCCFDPALRVVRWFVTLAGTGLPRHALCLDIERNAWWVEEYPFPVGASCVGLLGGERRVFLGGPGGAVYALGEGTLDCVDGSALTVRGTVTSSTPTSLTDSQAAFTPAAVGAPVLISGGRGKGQPPRRVVSATATTLRLDRPWQTAPDATSTYQVGGIKYRFRTGWFRWVTGEDENPRRLEVQFAPCSRPATLDARLYLDRSADPVEWDYDYTSDAGQGFASAAGETDWVADLTKPNGFVQRSVDGSKERLIDGPRLSSWELAGVTNRDEVVIHQVSIDGVQGRD